MKLIAYLNQHFFTREQLLARCGIDGERLDDLQRRGMMPQPSYRLRLRTACDSYFGAHEEEQTLEYYAQGYAAWLGLLQALDGPEQAFRVFAARYRQRIAGLAAIAMLPSAPDLADEMHLAAEWRHFLDGTYGLCTVSGLPEDIAAKEAAASLIGELTAGGPAHPLDEGERGRLRAAVDLLDRASAPFAPHEVARSSRHRLVDEVRTAWQL